MTRAPRTLLALLLLSGCPPAEVSKPDTEPTPDDSATEPLVDGDGDGSPGGEDCDDADPTVYPGAEEACNERDDDCDGAVDEDLPVYTFFSDGDEDGYGVPEPTMEACGEVPGWAARADDCDDLDPDVHPEARDRPHDGVDADCDGSDPCAEADHRWYKGNLRFYLRDDPAEVMTEFCKSYDAIEGGLSMEGDSYTDLEAFSCIVCISDYLDIEAPRLRSADGLDNLVWVGGNLGFPVSSLRDISALSSLRGVDGTLFIWDTDLVELSPLANLASLGALDLDALRVQDLSMFTWVQELDYLYIFTNDVPDLTGFSGLRSVRDLGLGSAGPMSIEGLGGLTHAEELTLTALPGVTDATVLAGAGPIATLFISTDGLHTLDGLNMAPVGEKLTVDNTTSLESLRGIEALEIGGQMNVYSNEDLTSLQGFDGLVETYTLLVNSNPKLRDLTGLGALEVASTLWVYDNDTLTSLSGAGSLREVDNFAVYGNPSLESVDGLEGLRIVNGSLSITSNEVLESVQALHGLEWVQDLTIVGNPNLSTAETDALLDAIGLENIYGELDVRDNGR